MITTHREGCYDPDWVAVAEDGTEARDLWRWVAILALRIKMRRARR